MFEIKTDKHVPDLYGIAGSEKVYRICSNVLDPTGPHLNCLLIKRGPTIHLE